jgi:hypothetical protein
MSVGDDALAAGFPIMTGNEEASTLDTEVNLTRDLIAQRTSAVTPIAKGGTGATSAAAARTALGITAENIPSENSTVEGRLDYLMQDKVHNASGGSNFLQLWWSGCRMHMLVDNQNVGQIANTGDLAGRVVQGQDVTFGHIFTPAGRGTPVNSSYVSAWINGDGRIGASASSRRYKEEIEEYEAPSILDLQPVTFVMKGDDKRTRRLGLIAEDVNDVEPLLVRHEDGEPEGVHYEFVAVALLAEVQRLAARVEELEARAGD